MTTNHTAAAIAAQVRSRRKSLGWSQAELAERAGVAPGTVSSLEQGKKVRPGNLHAIRTTLNLPDGDDEQPTPDSPREQKIQLALDLTERWLRARTDDELEAAQSELTRWIVARLYG